MDEKGVRKLGILYGMNFEKSGDKFVAGEVSSEKYFEMFKERESKAPCLSFNYGHVDEELLENIKCLLSGEGEGI